MSLVFICFPGHHFLMRETLSGCTLRLTEMSSCFHFQLTCIPTLIFSLNFICVEDWNDQFSCSVADGQGAQAMGSQRTWHTNSVSLWQWKHLYQGRLCFKSCSSVLRRVYLCCRGSLGSHFREKINVAWQYHLPFQLLGLGGTFNLRQDRKSE